MKNTLKEIVENPNTILIDVRDESEIITEGQLNNAINIPFENIIDKIDYIKRFKNPVVLFCKSGMRAKKAIDF